jgi:hypothetical protein
LGGGGEAATLPRLGGQQVAQRAPEVLLAGVSGVELAADAVEFVAVPVRTRSEWCTGTV